jgi:3-oxoacyl-[acyl-carrier protein] reductase
MFMSVVESGRGVKAYPEIAGARVLITGLTPAIGVDLARAFADHKARLVIQAPNAGPEIAALGGILSETALDLKLHLDAFADADEAVRFTQGAIKDSGGIDTLVNLVSVSRDDLAGRSSAKDIEDLVSEKLLAPTLITRIAANRMRLTLGTGMILNVVRMPILQTAAESAIAGVFRAALAAMTRGEAQQWADQAVRINAVAPRVATGAASAGACLTSEPDIAALALHLASKKGRNLSGHVFDAEGVAQGC